MTHNLFEVGFVVNYYWKPEYPLTVRSSAILALQSLKNCTLIDKIVLVDGSKISDTDIKNFCESNGIIYLHAGKELKFAEGFNIGWKHLNSYYIGLMASDVYPFPDAINTLLEALSPPDVGTVAPYLDFCDYSGQVFAFVRNPITCEPSSISLNLNIFKKTVLESIDGIDEKYTGGYNDLVMMMKIREKGHRVLLVGNTRVTHVGRLTVANGTQFTKKIDDIQFSKDFSQFRTKHGKWNIKHWEWPFATTATSMVLWWLAQNTPFSKGRKFLEWLTIWLEPEITKYPAMFGKRYK